MKTKTKKIGRLKKEESIKVLPGDIQIPDISKQLTDLTDIVLSLSNEVKGIRDQKAVEVKEEDIYEPKTHVHPTYLATVREVLGPEFGVESNLAKEDYGIQAIDDPRMIHIIVPDKYNTLTEKEKENQAVTKGQKTIPSTRLKDIRSKVIEDDNDLRLWCEQIRNNVMKYLQDEGKPRQYQL